MNFFSWLAEPAGLDPNAPIGAVIMIAIGLLLIGAGIGVGVQKGSFW